MVMHSVEDRGGEHRDAEPLTSDLTHATGSSENPGRFRVSIGVEVPPDRRAILPMGQLLFSTPRSVGGINDCGVVFRRRSTLKGDQYSKPIHSHPHQDGTLRSIALEAHVAGPTCAPWTYTVARDILASRGILMDMSMVRFRARGEAVPTRSVRSANPFRRRCCAQRDVGRIHREIRE